MSTAQQIIIDINAHMKQSGVRNSGWYVGIARDPRDRMFNAHNVPEKNHWWIIRNADTHLIAREVESAYHDAGCMGGPGGGDEATRSVYAYVITSATVE
jgi:hypothetical protein